mgnify:CR=1 FL=1
MSTLEHSPTTLQESVRLSISKYLQQIEGANISNIYDLVLAEVEKPLLETIMLHTRGNQSKAARWLGLSRNTLRKLLGKYKLDDSKENRTT